MKTLFVLVFLAFVSVASATEYCTVYNYTGVPLLFQQNPTYIDKVIPAGASFYAVRDSAWQIISLESEYWGAFNCDTPIIYVGSWGQTEHCGEWTTVFGTSGEIAQGFSLGLAVWALCAASAWMVKIGKQFASSAT